MVAKVLVVDDEKAMRYAFKTHLLKAGYNVLTADGFETALKIISEKAPDVVIVDIILKGYNGIDILREIKKTGRHSPVIMITGKPNIDTATEAIRLGAFDYLFKPVRKETLLHITGQALRHKKLWDEKERYRRNLSTIFASLKDAIIAVDQNHQIIELNTAAKRICGAKSQDVIGTSVELLDTKCRKKCFMYLTEEHKDNSWPIESRIECNRPDRPGQMVAFSVTPLTNEGRKFDGAILTARDVTRLNRLENELKQRNSFHNIIGRSQAMQKVYELLRAVAETDTTVLVRGESGTGKELIARALHFESARATHPLVTVNCSAFNENLLESELFGHVRGAFTGAVNDRTGRFQLANEGTIFLDEIGDISPLSQLKLLRVIQEREFEKVGDTTPVRVNVRIIAATHRDLHELVRTGQFRADLYYRIKVVEIQLPRLRERTEDIQLLVESFRRDLNESMKKNIRDVSDEVMSTFMDYSWPGNIRELRHSLEHAFVVCRGDTIIMKDLPAELQHEVRMDSLKTTATSNMSSAMSPNISNGEREKLMQVLQATDWNKSETARRLGINRRTVYRKMKKYTLKRS